MTDLVIVKFSDIFLADAVYEEGGGEGEEGEKGAGGQHHRQVTRRGVGVQHRLAGQT